MSEKIRVGVIGLGFIGLVHVEQLRRLGFVDVVAVVDTIDAEAKAANIGVPKGYSDYKEMIEKENLSAIHVCTPNFSHYEIAMYAMDKGLHVLCEKPLCCTIDEAQKMVAKAKEKNVVHSMNLNCRFYPMAYRAKQMVESGEVGNIYTIHGGYFQDWLYLDTDYSWRVDSSVSGKSRAFADIGSHWIDLVEFITGLRVVELLAEFETFHKTRKKPLKPIETYSGMALRPEDYQEMPIDTEDFATVIFKFENGAIGSCNVHQMFAGKKNQMQVSIAGSKCSVQWDSENSNELIVGHREKANETYVKDPSILDMNTRGVISYPGGHVEGFPDTFKQNFNQIYTKIKDPSSTKTDFATFEDGLREVVLCEAIIDSAKERKWVKVK